MPRTVPSFRSCAVAASLALAGSLSLSACRDEAPVPAALPPLQLPALVPPLADAKPGEELVLRRGDAEFRWRVVRDAGQELEVEYQAYEKGAPSSGAERMVWHRSGFGLKPEWIIQSFVRERIEVAGRTFDCWRMHVRSMKESRWFWISDEAPAHGVVRLAVDRGKGVPDDASAAEIVPEHCSPPVSPAAPAGGTYLGPAPSDSR